MFAFLVDFFGFVFKSIFFCWLIWIDDVIEEYKQPKKAGKTSLEDG